MQGSQWRTDVRPWPFISEKDALLECLASPAGRTKKKTKQPTAVSNWQTVLEDEVERIARRSTQLINWRVVC